MPRIVISSADWAACGAKLAPKLPHDSYFKRMTSYDYGEGTTNQIADAIESLNKLSSAGARIVDPGPVVLPRPGRQAMAKRSFPCLSQVQLHRYDGRLVGTATYRSHHYHQRALGNFIGLGRLMKLVARETGLDVGELTVVSTDARVGNIGRLEALLHRIAA